MNFSELNLAVQLALICGVISLLILAYFTISGWRFYKKEMADEKQDTVHQLVQEDESLMVRDCAPYSVVIENTTDEKKQAIIFGFARFYDSENYGSDKGITVRSSCADVRYCELLSESAFKNFEIDLFRFHTENLAQFKEVLGVHYRSANGQAAFMPVVLATYDKKSDHREQKTLLDVDFKMKVAEDTFLTLNVLPNTKIILHMFRKLKHSGIKITSQML